MKYGVYKITNLENRKSYIGSSANQARQGNTCCVGRQLSVDTKTNISQSRKGQRNHSKLTENDIQTIRTLIDQGIVQTKIAERFCVSQGTISMIKHRRRWNN